MDIKISIRFASPTLMGRSSFKHNLDKFINTQRNLSRLSPKLWSDQDSSLVEVDSLGLYTLISNNPVLCTLGSCNGTMKEYNQVHARLIVSGIFQHPLAASQFIKKLCSSRTTFLHAVSLFDHFEEPDAFICNTIMRGYLNFDDPHGALNFYYDEMLGRGLKPNHFTFPLLVKISAELGLVWQGERSHALISKVGMELDLFVQNSLIHMYSVFKRVEAACRLFDASSHSDLVTWNSMIDGYLKNGNVAAARKLFDVMWERDLFSWNSIIAGYVGIRDMEAAKELFKNMPLRDVVSWNCMIDGYARLGNVKDAHELFDKMPFHNAVSWNTMMALFVRCKEYNECLRLFDQMIGGGKIMPNEATLVSALTACAHLGMLDKGKWVHLYIKNNLYIKPDILLSTALLTMYAKCGATDLARHVFDDMPDRNVVSWNSMIQGYGMHGHAKKALEVFLEMEKSGTMPNAATLFVFYLHVDMLE